MTGIAAPITLRLPRFINNGKTDFHSDLRKEVENYFTDKKLDKNGDSSLIPKAVLMFALYFAGMYLMTGVPLNWWQGILASVLCGLGAAGAGLGIMHDANHGSFSKHEKVNKWLAHSMTLLGGSRYVWQVRHNVLHHTYTNVQGWDEDIDTNGVLRLSPNEPYKPAHRYQHIYAWFLYLLMTFSMMWNDFIRFEKFKKKGVSYGRKVNYRRELAEIWAVKIVYLFMFLALPVILGHSSFLEAFAHFMIMQCTIGLLLSLVFQAAHITEGSEYPMPEAPAGHLEKAWAEHQLLTTANFATDNKVLTWLIGGLNYQIEHHLFPNISHIHYPKISEIVRATAEKHNLTYRDFPSFGSAIASHYRVLKSFGKK